MRYTILPFKCCGREWWTWEGYGLHVYRCHRKIRVGH